MFDQKRILEAEKNIKEYIKDQWIFIKRKDMPQNIDFFLKNAETSILTAQTLFDLSSDINKKQAVNLESSFESYLWVIVSSYYSMFYSSLAILANNEIKVGEKLVHKVVADVLISEFLKNKKLAKLIDSYEETKDKAMQIIGSEEKAGKLIENFEFERNKRSSIQYDLGVTAKFNLANTSLGRAKEFVAEIKNILKK